MSTENQTREDIQPGRSTAAFRLAIKRCLLAILIVAPLLYENIKLIRLGYRPSQAGLSIELGQTLGTLEIEDDQGEGPE